MDSWANETVLVTGGTGFIGGHLAGRLLESGAKVRVLARSLERAAFLAQAGAQVIPGDITDLHAVQAAAQGCHWVFHFAGITSEFLPWSDYEAVHVRGSENAARAAIQAGAERFVYASSIAVYGLYPGEDLGEETPHRPCGDAYSDTKLQAEEVVRRLVREEGLPAVILQPGITYGPRDQTWTLGPLRRIRSRQMVLPGGGRALFNPIFVADLVEGILQAAGRGQIGEAYLLAGPEVITFRAYFSRLAALAGGRSIPSVPLSLVLLAASLSETFARLSGAPPPLTRSEVRWASTSRTFSNEKARRELGFQPQTGLEAGMSQIEAWLHLNNV